jgi:hypothetical protein
MVPVYASVGRDADGYVKRWECHSKKCLVISVQLGTNRRPRRVKRATAI